jgi:hypothetical protein
MRTCINVMIALIDFISDHKMRKATEAQGRYKYPVTLRKQNLMFPRVHFTSGWLNKREIFIKIQVTV